MVEQKQLELLKKDILQNQINLSDSEWISFQKNVMPVAIKKGTIIFSSTEVCKHILFITEGFTASEYLNDGNYILSRFFQKGNLCTNLISMLNEKVSNDQLIAVTNVKGILIPSQLFMEHYLNSDKLGQYVRQKVIATLMEDKYFISIKTISGTRAKLTFLQKKYPEILLQVPWKYIAAFMGVTPAWLSRILKNNKTKDLPFRK